ncbi:hypothetical protein TTHERM_00994410 (macronuclear) [Tetrahymena thermophila SB210]|uniref:Uncharacterized protein n=1 Tax=Tetrahymena thermophila (strain SB210) TaxID=312017 RepID=Q247Q6_TETTS|nr:hypothetical protein TTHERM_00994410 [Tetrahymena thermophila SB210]EAS04044.2 hypothetical protein TTHERM_00994410 [Tetrahymena thermophila SB210]|eukprot:XP_001024289.2 hypothetical protein TTHERM_00994410 [Tetrahymena thermophila SB210]
MTSFTLKINKMFSLQICITTQKNFKIFKVMQNQIFNNHFYLFIQMHIKAQIQIKFVQQLQIQNMILSICFYMNKLIIVHKLWKKSMLIKNKIYFYVNIVISSKQYKFNSQKMVRSLAYVNHVIANTFLSVMLIILNQGKVIGESNTLLIKMKLSHVQYPHKIVLEAMSQRIVYVTKVTQDLNAQTVIQKDNIGIASIPHMVTFPATNVVIQQEILQKFVSQLYQFQQAQEQSQLALLKAYKTRFQHYIFQK